jgi:hypothetical protein
MRPLLELFVVAMVIYAGWNQPFRDHAAALFPDAGIKPSAELAKEKKAVAPTPVEPANNNPNVQSRIWNERVVEHP